MKKLCYIIIFIFSITLVAAKLPVKITLTYNPKQGTSSVYEMHVKSFLTLNNINLKAVDLKLQNFITYMDFIFTNTVDKTANDGSITETLTYNSFKLEQEIMGMRTPINMGFDLAGKSFKTTTSKDGKLKNSKGFEALAPALQDLRLDNFFLQINPEFPQKAVKVGDAWNNETNSSLPIKNSLVKTNLKSTYTLQGFEKTGIHNCVIVGIEVSINTETIPVKQEHPDYVVDVTIKGNGTGKIFYDYEQSRIISSQITMNLKSIIKTTADTGSSKLDTDQRVEMNLKLTK